MRWDILAFIILTVSAIGFLGYLLGKGLENPPDQGEK